MEYDPTNGLIAGRNLIRVSMAREPHQATPLSGGYIGRAEDFRSMSVRVEVTVGDPPTEEELALEAAEKAAAEAAKAASDTVEVPDAPGTPLTVLAELPEPEAARREVDLTTS